MLCSDVGVRMCVCMCVREDFTERKRQSYNKYASVCVCVCVSLPIKQTDSNSVCGLVILTVVSPVYSLDPPEEKHDA